MAVVEFDIKDFEKLSGLKKDQIIEGLTNIGAPCEEEKEVKKIIVELTPNRPDWFALEGMARSLRAYYHKEIKEYKAKKGDYVVEVDKSVAQMRPYTVCALIKGLKMTDERIVDMVQVQEKLCATLGRWRKKFAMGLYPMETIKFPLRYTTMKPEEIRYQPLDYPKEADGHEILEKHEKGAAYGEIIKDFKRWPVYVDANNEVMALLPLINSAKTGQVGLGTKDIFIEVTGIDENVIHSALNILVTMFADMGGQIHTVRVKYPDHEIETPVLSPKKMKVDTEAANKLLGAKLKKSEVRDLLARMGYLMNGDSVLVPPYRADVIHEVDVIEDIAIAYGYNRFEPTLPDFFNSGSRNRKLEALHATMRGMGFLEMTTFILTNQNKVESIGYRGEVKEIVNPRVEEFTCLRPTMLVDLLNIFELNKTKGLPQRLYEIGNVYVDESTQQRLVFGIMDKSVGFSDAKGFLQTLMSERGIDFELVKTKHTAFDPEKSGDVVVSKKRIGVFGKIKEEILKQYSLDFEVYACELEVDRGSH
jgi:phenylalanyl-tRNA synthetase beta chain